MPTIERGEGRCVAPRRRAVGLAILIAVAGCSSGSSSTTASRPVAAKPTTTTTAPRASGPSVIIDTDLSRWWDDATAIGLANVLQQQGALNVLGIVTDIRNPVAVAAVDAINTAYGNGDIPLGAVAHSDADTAPRGYSDTVVATLAARRSQQRRRSRRGRALPPRARGATRPQRHDRRGGCVHEPCGAVGVTGRARTGCRKGQATRRHGRTVPRRRSGVHESEARPRGGARRGRRYDRRGCLADPDRVGRRPRRDRDPGRVDAVCRRAGGEPHADRLREVVLVRYTPATETGMHPPSCSPSATFRACSACSAAAARR